MATLEIHDARGRVSYVTIHRDQHWVLGTDPKCDIVLDDPSARPFHARISWRKGRYKVEATPEARAIEVNGKKLAAASFRQGGELRLGATRVFLIAPDDGPAETEKAPAHSKKTQAARAGDWAAEDVAPPSQEDEFDDVEAALAGLASQGGAVSSKPTRLKSRAKSRQAPEAEAAGRDRDTAKPEAAAPRVSLWKRAHAYLVGREQRPGQERILSSPIVIGLVFALVILSGLGLGLYGVIHQMASNRAFARANESLDNGEYRNAIEQFNAFLENFPNDERGNQARVLSALSEVRQFMTGANPAYSTALNSAQTMYADLGDLPEFEDVRADLAGAVLDIATTLADRALRAADGESLRLAEQAVLIHNNIGGEAAETAQERVRLPQRLADARAAVTKALTRTDALEAMDAAIDAGDPDGAYDARDRLIARYPDLERDADVLERLRSANELIQAAVRIEETPKSASTEPRPDPLGPPVSLVLRSPEQPAQGGPLVFALVEGFAYAIDSTTGAPVWHAPIGLDAPFPPQPISGAESDLIAFDARHGELLRLDRASGDLVWRLALDEPIEHPPLVLLNQIIQPTPSGKLLFINGRSGTLTHTIDFGRRITQTPVADELARNLYVLGNEDILYIITRDPLDCAQVEYVGHGPGSVACPPARLGEYLIVPENHRIDSGRWLVFVMEDQGLSLRPLQRIPIDGWTWDTPASANRVIWSASDRGGIEAFEVSPPDVADPFRSLVKVASESVRLGPTFLRARSDRELWIASSRSARYQLEADVERVRSAWTLVQAGPAIAPPQFAGDRLVLTQQPERGPGAALWGVDARSGSVAWRTVLGSPWPTLPEPAINQSGLATLSSDGGRLLVPSEALETGGFITEPLPSPGDLTVRLQPGRVQQLETPEATLIFPEPDADFMYIHTASAADLERVELPAPLAARPILWEGELLVPGNDGRVYLIDPTTGAPEADPFLSTFNRDDPTLWLAPMPLDDGAVLLAERDGTIRRLAIDRTDRPRLRVTDETKLDSPPIADPASTGDAVLIATADQRIRALSARDLSPAGAWDLDAPLAVGPSADPQNAYVVAADVAGTVIAFGPGGQRLWTTSLEGGQPAGPPALADNGLWLLSLEGILFLLDLENGSTLERHDLGPLPAGGAIPADGRLLVPSSPGTLRMLTESP